MNGLAHRCGSCLVGAINRAQDMTMNECASDNILHE